MENKYILPQIKPIETIYYNTKFRSRLEARWACFFTSTGTKWEYEKEGYDLGGGEIYLPDFWIPSLKLWVEIKPDGSIRPEPEIIRGSRFYDPWSTKELNKISKLECLTGWPSALVEGSPGGEKIYFCGQEIGDSSGGSYFTEDALWCIYNGHLVLDSGRKCDHIFISHNMTGESMPWFTYPINYQQSRHKIDRAYYLARSERFGVK